MKGIEQISNVVKLLKEVIDLQLRINGKLSKEVQYYCDFYYIKLTLLESKLQWEINKVKY